MIRVSRLVPRRLRFGIVSFCLSAILAILAVGGAIAFIAASGVSPVIALETYVRGAFGSWAQTAGTVSRAVPLVIVAMAWIIVFRGGRFHIGFPGQIIVGGAAAAAVALNVPAPGAVVLALAVTAAVIAGAFYAGMASTMRVRWGTNEILSTLLMNLIAVQFLEWLVNGPMQESGGFGLAQTDPFPSDALWPTFFDQPTMRWDFVLVPLVVIGMTILLARTSFGFRVRLAGANPLAARYAGVSLTRVAVIAMLISGGLAGLAGSSLVLASGSPAMASGFEGGYGFEGIVVALLARNSPIGAIASALYFAALGQGSSLVQAQLGVPSALLYVTQGLVIVFVLASTTLLHRIGSRVAGFAPADALVREDEVEVASPVGAALPSTVGDR